MRALVQRVSRASVSVNGEVSGEIGAGLCVFLGVKHNDTLDDSGKLAAKIIHLRIFRDNGGKMNWNLNDTSGGLLIVPQFTLYGDSRKGNRPSYSEAAEPEFARRLYEAFVGECKKRCSLVSTGIFQADMQVSLINDGPVTLMCEV